MGRHGVAARRHGRYLPSRSLVIGLAVLILAAAGLGVWWWSLRSTSDPVSADPVSGTATVVFSPRCDVGSSTVIDVALTPPVRASLSGCGFEQNQTLAIDYLAGHPDQVRLAGTGATGPTGPGRWLPWVILAVGVLIVGTLLVVLADLRRDHRIRAAHRISVADLQRALAQQPATAAAEETTRISTATIPDADHSAA